MPTMNVIKEQEVTDTPLFLFEVKLASGDFQRFCTHSITVDNNVYAAKVTRHNVFDVKSSSEEGIDAFVKIAVTLANADSYFSEVERNVGWKGAQVTVRFVFADLIAKVPTTSSVVLFQGIANAPDEITESTLRLTLTNRLNLQRISLPEVRIQRRCPWLFPSTIEQRQEAVSGGASGLYSKFYKCGYSADQADGVGNLNAGKVFDTCNYTRSQCEERGMFNKDGAGRDTRRFGGIEFVPASIIVRGFGEKGSHVSSAVESAAIYNDTVPLLYGTAWYQPPIVFARNDGNLTHMEVLLGMGEMQGVLKVIVNEIEIPLGQAAADMTATGWYNIIGLGTRTGALNADFTDPAGNPLGDPYGGMGLLSVVIPNRISNGLKLPKIDVLAQGLKLSRFNTDGTFLDSSFTQNPAWVLLDVLRRSGWRQDEIDLESFATTAQFCDGLVPAQDLHGNPVQIPRFQCNLILRKRRSAAEVARGIRTACGLYLNYGSGGLLALRPENTLTVQQPTKSDASNSTLILNDGWPAYEFSDSSASYSGIRRRDNGESSVRIRSKSFADTPNRVSVEFQDEFNEYQHDSLSLIDLDDSLLSGQETAANSAALGIPNFSQAARVLRLQLDKAVRGNVFVDFETSVRALGLKPGDLITLTYAKEGWSRQLFRVIRLSPDQNYRSAVITAQIHDEEWYNDTDSTDSGPGGRRQPHAGLGIPRPLVGNILDSQGKDQFEITEKVNETSDGSATVTLTAGFVEPLRSISGTVGIPLLSLTPEITSTGGTLPGNVTYYYCLSAVDNTGGEGRLSFSVKATIPTGTNTNRVRLTTMSFSSTTAAFNVYRGVTPSQLLRIASNLPIASDFSDTGLPNTLQGPPDENYDHANFYFRLEVQPPTPVDITSATTIGNSTLGLLPNENTGMTVRIISGRGAAQEATILSNTTTTFTLASKWRIEPDATSTFTVAESGWRFGAVSQTSPIDFDVPNRRDGVVQISGRSANAHDRESAYELSPLTRWRIGGSSGSGGLDSDVPGVPTFGLFPTGQGTVDLVAVAFTDLSNVRTVTAGTFTLHYWDELLGVSSYSLANALDATATLIDLNSAGAAQLGDLIQIESEVMKVEATSNGGMQYQVLRGSSASTAVAHAAQTLIYHLERTVFIVPFVRDFFGSPSSGSYAHSIFIPDVRIATAELFVTNTQGNSGTATRSFTATIDAGIRTLSGGQFSIQIDGELAIQTSAAPPLMVDSSHSVRDVFAVVSVAPLGAPVTMQLNQNNVAYCTLTIPAGETISNVVNGFELPPLQAGLQITLDITSVVQTGDSAPGRDLTVTVRL